MASLYKKVISGKPYWYLREMGWADGKPKLVSERYLGTAADIEALLDAREAAVLPERTRHLAFGDVAAAWGVLQDLGVAAIIDEVTGARRSDAGASAAGQRHPGRDAGGRSPLLLQHGSRGHAHEPAAAYHSGLEPELQHALAAVGRPIAPRGNITGPPSNRSGGHARITRSPHRRPGDGRPPRRMHRDSGNAVQRAGHQLGQTPQVPT